MPAADEQRIEQEEGAATSAPSSDAQSDANPSPAMSRAGLSPDGDANPALDDEEALAHDAEAEPEEPDWKDLAHRKAAELDNFRKQAAQRVQKASRDGAKRVAAEILPALDDFERALAHAEAEEGDEQHTLTKGIRLVQDQLLAALRRAGIESFLPLGEQFDPHMHEAVSQVPVDGVQSGTVVEVYQAGYRLGEDVLRAAKVVVAA